MPDGNETSRAMSWSRRHVLAGLGGVGAASILGSGLTLGQGAGAKLIDRQIMWKATQMCEPAEHRLRAAVPVLRS